MADDSEQISKTRANFYLDPGYYDRLKKVAAARGLSTSEIVRVLVRAYVERAEAADAGSNESVDGAAAPHG